MPDSSQSPSEVPDLSAPQREATSRDRITALRLYDPDLTCVCGHHVVLAWDWKRQEAVTLRRVASHSGKFQVTTPLNGDFTCRGKGLATFLGWGGTHVKHECPGPQERPEFDPATLPALGFIGGHTPEEDREHAAMRHPEQWGRISCADLLAADNDRRQLPHGNAEGIRAK